MASRSITASSLYDFIQCPHKVWRDSHGPQDERIIEKNPFVQMLWEKGVQHEKEIVNSIGAFIDLGEGSMEERKAKTSEAINNKVKIIYQGVIQDGDLLGIPDLLVYENEEYTPIDIKSGMGTETDIPDSEGKLKKHYAVQLGVYVDVLRKMGVKTDHTAKIIDRTGAEIVYDLNKPMGVKNPTTYWNLYEQVKQEVAELIANTATNKPALAGICKMCDWYNSCKKWCMENDDPTLIYYLGRKVRDTLETDMSVHTIADLLTIDIDATLQRKKKDKDFLKGVGESSLVKAVRRGKILSRNAPPVRYKEIVFPKVDIELFFDIEDDPTQEFVYMHGVYERRGKEERFIHFTAKAISDEAEKEAWSDFWTYIRSLPRGGYAVYYYSNHERTIYMKLREKYPDVISKEEIEAFFDDANVIDLFRVVNDATDWPLSSYSIKEIAVYSGFKWRDETPSGALSIQWFNEYIRQKDEKILKRILEYNEDDCKATKVVKDAISALKPA